DTTDVHRSRRCYVRGRGNRPDGRWPRSRSSPPRPSRIPTTTSSGNCSHGPFPDSPRGIGWALAKSFSSIPRFQLLLTTCSVCRRRIVVRRPNKVEGLPTAHRCNSEDASSLITDLLASSNVQDGVDGRVFWFCCALVLAATACDRWLTSPSLYNTVTVVVTTRGGSPIPGAALTLYTGQRPMGYASTGADGRYVFQD